MCYINKGKLFTLQVEYSLFVLSSASFSVSLPSTFRNAISSYHIRTSFPSPQQLAVEPSVTQKLTFAYTHGPLESPISEQYLGPELKRGNVIAQVVGLFGSKSFPVIANDIYI